MAGTQSRLASFIESVVNTLSGYIFAVVLQAIVFPLYNLPISFSENLQIAAIFTVASILRNYIVRRLFNAC